MTNEPCRTMLRFCRAVKDHLETRGISQNKLADIVGESSGSISRLLSGKRGNCNISLMESIADALGTTVSDLTREDDDEMVSAAGHSASRMFEK